MTQRSQTFKFLAAKHDGGDWRISSPFGTRSMGWHGGIDIGSYTGTALYSPFDDGVIDLVRPGSPSAGNYVRVYYPKQDILVRFLHLHRFAAGLKAGQRVDQSTLLGYTGNTGQSTGAHLHLDITIGNVFMRQTDCADPIPFLKAAGQIDG